MKHRKYVNITKYIKNSSRFGSTKKVYKKKTTPDSHNSIHKNVLIYFMLNSTKAQNQKLQKKKYMDENENGKKRVVSSRFSTIPVIINQMHQPLCQATPVNSLDGGVTFCDIKIQKKKTLLLVGVDG